MELEQDEGAYADPDRELRSHIWVGLTAVCKKVGGRDDLPFLE